MSGEYFRVERFTSPRLAFSSLESERLMKVAIPPSPSSSGSVMMRQVGESTWGQWSMSL